VFVTVSSIKSSAVLHGRRRETGDCVMAAGPLSPQDRDVLLRAIIAGGGGGLEDPAASLQNLLKAPGGMSAAQAIVAGLRNRLLPQGAPGAPGGPSGPAGPATLVARGLSGAEPTYAQDDNERSRPSGILGGPKAPEKKSDDVTDAAKKLVEKTPSPPEPPSKAAGGILAMGPSQGPDPGTVSVPNIPDVPSTVNRSVARGKDADLTRSWMNFLMKPVDQGGLGRTLAQATGEVASLRGESPGLAPDKDSDFMPGRGATSFGTAAWHDPKPGVGRKTNLINFSQARGLDYKTTEAQQLFYKSEMEGAYKHVNNRIMAARTPQEAMNVHIEQFEVPANIPKQQSLRAKHIPIVQAAMAGAREVASGPDSRGRGATAGPGLDPSLKPPPAPTQKAAPQQTGILPAPRPDVQAPTAPDLPSFGGAGKRPVSALIVHHTAGDKAGNVPQTADDVKAVYQQRGLAGAHLFLDRQGNISQTLPFSQAGQHIRDGQGPGVGLSNENTIGIEIAAKDDRDITPEQRESMKRLYPQLQQQFPGLKVFGHGEINPHKLATEGATVVGDLRGLGQNLPKPGEDVPLPPRRPTDLAAGDQAAGDQPLTVNVTPSGTESAPAPEPDPDFANVTPAEQSSLGGDDMGGLPDLSGLSGQDQADLGGLGGILGGLGGGSDDSSADNAPSMLSEWDKQDAKEPDKPILPPEDTKPGGILSGDDSLLADQGQGRVDLSRMFSPEGFGGTGLLGRDQGPDASGFKAPVGLAQGGQIVGPPGILGGPSGGIASITPPQLRSIAPPIAPPSRPSGIDVNLATPAPALQPPDVMPPPRRPDGLTTSALPPPRPLGIGGEVPLPPRRPSGLLGDPPSQPLGADPGLVSAPDAPAPVIPPMAPLGTSNMPGAQLGAIGSPPAVDPDRFTRDAPATPQPTGILGSPRAQPAMPGILGRTFGDDAAKPTPPGSVADLSRLMDALGGASGLLAGSGSGGSGSSFGSSVSSGPIATASDRRRFLANARRPMGLLSGGQAQTQMDLNRYFGLLSGRVG
jgi:hypothetical protein